MDGSLLLSYTIGVSNAKRYWVRKETEEEAWQEKEVKKTRA